MIENTWALVVVVLPPIVARYINSRPQVFFFSFSEELPSWDSCRFFKKDDG